MANTKPSHMDSDAIEAEKSKERRTSELKPEGLRDEMQRVSRIDTGLEGRTRKHTGEANSSGLDACSIGEQIVER